MSDTVLTQGERGRNSNRSSSHRSRCWCFTLNNQMEAEIQKILNSEHGYVMQEETGKQGTNHLQGVMKFKNPVRFSTVKKFLLRAHWEPCKKWIASVQYCSKVETRSGRMWSNVIDVNGRRENGTVALTQNEKKNIEENKLFNENFKEWKKIHIEKDVEDSMISWELNHSDVDLFMGMY